MVKAGILDDLQVTFVNILIQRLLRNSYKVITACEADEEKSYLPLPN